MDETVGVEVFQTAADAPADGELDLEIKRFAIKNELL